MDIETTYYESFAEVTEDFYCSAVDVLKLLVLRLHDYHARCFYDELELDKLGDRKTALFLIMSDTDSTFNFLISMIYTQLFNLL